MGRATRIDVGDMVYHVINRANFRSELFSKDKHYRNFLDILEEATEIVPMRILSFCLMPNHWHLVLYPKNEGNLSRFMHWVTLTHTRRYHTKTKTIGYGHMYQGRYKSIPVERDRYFWALVRYVERNAKRAGLVKNAEDWKWSSIHIRLKGTEAQKKLLSPWPVEEPNNYRTWIIQSEPIVEIENIRYAIQRNRPYGSEQWVDKTVKKFGLESTIRNPWRPKKGT
jgi:putative transposase